MTNAFYALLLSTAFLASPVVADVPSVATGLEHARVPISVFGRQPFMRGPRISPDGRKIVFQIAREGKGAIAVLDLNNPSAKPVLIAATNEIRDVGDRTIQGFRWVGNDNVVLTLLSRENIFGQRGDVSRLVGFNLKTKKRTPLAWDGAVFSASNILFTDHDKETVLLERESNAYGTEMMQTPEVVSVNVNTGQFTIVQRPNPIVGSWYADGKGVIRAAAAGDSRSDVTGKQRILYRSSPGEQFHTVINEADATFAGGIPTPDVFLDEPDMALTTSNKDGFRKVYKLDLKTMKLGEMVYQFPGYDVPEAGLILNWDRNKLMGVKVTDRRDHDVWFDKDWKIIQQVMDEQFGAGNAQAVSRDRKDEKIIFFVAKGAQPGAYYLFDTVSGKLQNIGWYSAALKDATMNPMSTMTYTARDGTKISAVVTMPRHRAAQKNLPVVILPHGGPFGVRQQEEFGYFPWHQALAEQGYVVIEPNYRGSGGYGKAFVLLGRRPEGYGKTMQDDLNDALTSFAGKGVVDAKRACIMGWSYGGYAAARGAQRDPDVWRCAIAGAGIYDNPMMTRWDKENLSTFSSKFQNTSNDPEGISSARHTDGKWAPILIVAGLRDQRIPIEQPRTLVSRLKASGKHPDVDFRYIEQPQGTHNLPYEDVHIQFLEETQKWLERFNPAYVASDPDKPVPIAASLETATKG